MDRTNTKLAHKYAHRVNYVNYKRKSGFGVEGGDDEDCQKVDGRRLSILGAAVA